MTTEAVAKATEKRTQQRLAPRKEAARRGVETRKRKQEARAKGETAKAKEQAPEAPRATEPQGVDQPARSDGRAAAMATAALRGEEAERFRALAAKQGLTLSKLLVRMMDAFEAQVARPTAATAAPTGRGLAAG